ncbi:hypothetical protein [Cypionkella sp. TWP1-2-1b2]|uniref:hypothetical protein n=1 Tax=Cypionkella sp. TWP1-2-1b2 TaxID=2804675 RepID=UPI003CFACF0F
MKIGIACGAAAFALWPGLALAHGMGNSVGFRLTLESMLESINSPVIPLLLIGFAVLAGTSGADRARLAAGCFLAGLLAGIPAANGSGVYGAVAALSVGALCSVVSAASLRATPKFVLPVLSVAAGLAATIYNLDGHAVASLPIAVHFGIVLGPFITALALISWIVIILEQVTFNRDHILRL